MHILTLPNHNLSMDLHWSDSTQGPNTHRSTLLVDILFH